MRLSAVIRAHFLKSLSVQQQDNLRVKYQAQVTCRGLSYEAIFFYSVTSPRETFHCAKRLAVVREEGPAEGLFGKEPAPPPVEIQILPPHNLPRGTLFRLAFPTPPI